MTRRLRTERCPDCALPAPLCVCDALPRLLTRTTVVVLAHVKELARPSNTGRLVPLTLVRGALRVRGARAAAPEPEVLLPQPVAVLFPGDDASPIEDVRPATLLVPDGSWPQARRAVARDPLLVGRPRVVLPPGPPARATLRHHPDPGHLGTLEAVARALGLLEGEPVQVALEAALLRFAEAVCRTRRGGT